MCPSSPEEPAQPEAREAARRPVFIMGSRGKMGLMLSERLRGAGYEVEGYDVGDQSEDASLAEAIRPSIHDDSIIVMCVPVGRLREALASVTSLLGPDNLLMDITSVKSLPMQWMEEAYKGMVVGSHPLFGPNPNPVDMRVALVRGEKAHDAACLAAENIFKDIGCETFWSTAREHDAGVAIAQSLNFTVSAAFFSTLARQKCIRQFLTPSFKRHLEAARKHLTIDTEMFLEFTSMNPEYAHALGEYRKVLDEIAAGGLPGVAKEAALWYSEKPAEETKGS